MVVISSFATSTEAERSIIIFRIILVYSHQKDHYFQYPMKPIGVHNYFVYILTNKKKTVLYIGVTNDLKTRLYYHENPISESGRLTFTTKYKCFYLIYFDRYQYIEDALERERQLKKWNRSKKEELIDYFNPEWKFLNNSI